MSSPRKPSKYAQQFSAFFKPKAPKNQSQTQQISYELTQNEKELFEDRLKNLNKLSEQTNLAEINQIKAKINLEILNDKQKGLAYTDALINFTAQNPTITSKLNDVFWLNVAERSQSHAKKIYESPHTQKLIGKSDANMRKLVDYATPEIQQPKKTGLKEKILEVLPKPRIR